MHEWKSAARIAGVKSRPAHFQHNCAANTGRVQSAARFRRTTNLSNLKKCCKSFAITKVMGLMKPRSRNAQLSCCLSHILSESYYGWQIDGNAKIYGMQRQTITTIFRMQTELGAICDATNTLSPASIFSPFSIYSICLDWFTLFCLHVGRRFWHSLQCIRWYPPTYLSMPCVFWLVAIFCCCGSSSRRTIKSL